jgi:hypothetical protein
MLFSCEQSSAHLMSAALPLCAIRQIVLYALHFVLLLIGFAVFADAMNAAFVGAPLLPGFFMRSGVLPAAF